MISTLIEKELREHWAALAAVAIASLVGLLLIMLSAVVRDDQGSALAGLRVFLIMFVTIACLVLGNRLVVREYQGKTQLFLEALPLTRVRIITVKYLLGLGLLVAVVTIVLGLLTLLASRREFISMRFYQIVATRTYCFTLFLYSFFFVMGLLGRYRVAIYLVIFIGMAMIDSMTDLDLRHFGPVALVDERFPFERDELPVQPLLVTLGMAVGFTVLAYLLALMREGSAAALLAQKMTHREKVFIAVLVLGMLFLGYLYDTKREKEPFDLSGAIVEQSHAASVKLAVGSVQEQDAGRRLSRRVHDELAAVTEYLNLAWSPPVFVTTRRDLDANRYELGTLTESEGLLVRVNLSAANFDEKRFLAWLVREFLIAASRGRARLEPKMWVLDGFGLFWVRRDQAGSELLDDRMLALRALYGTADGFGDRERTEWLRFRERVGDDVAAAVAWSGLTTLSRQQGSERCQAFLRSMLGRAVDNDVRAWFTDRRYGLEDQLELTAGVRWPEFLKAWQAELDAARGQLPELARLPRLTAQVTFEPLSPDTRVVKYRVTIEPPPPQDDSRVALLYASLGVFDEPVDPRDWEREEFDFSVEQEGELPGTRARGDRFISTLSLEVHELGCAVISGWSRQEIR
jgi:hypothetical protein